MEVTPCEHANMQYVSVFSFLLLREAEQATWFTFNRRQKPDRRNNVGAASRGYKTEGAGGSLRVGFQEGSRGGASDLAWENAGIKAEPPGSHTRSCTMLT